MLLKGFTFNITPKVNDDLRNVLESSTGLINSESGQGEFSSVHYIIRGHFLYITRGHFFSRKKSTEEAIEKVNKIGTDFYINKSYFLYRRSGFIKQTFITALSKAISIYDSINNFNKKKTKKGIIKVINPEEFKFCQKKDTLKDSLSLQLTNVRRKVPQLRESKIHNFS